MWAPTSACRSARALILRAFIFFHSSDAEFGLLVAAEVFVLKATKPIGIGAIEVDLEQRPWSALIGVDLELAKLLDTDSDLAKGLGRLTGTIFAGNQPGMFAIGQLTDQASWLTLSVNKSLLGMQARVSVALCLQIATGDGPRGFGLAVTATRRGYAGHRQGAVLRRLRPADRRMGQRGELVGVHRVGRGRAADQGVLGLLVFGASVKAVFEQLGPQEPNYRRVSLEVRIETPWWLPDVTFRVVRVREAPRPETMPVLSAPLPVGGRARAGTAHRDPGRRHGARARRARCTDRRAARAALRAGRRGRVGGAGAGQRRRDHCARTSPWRSRTRRPWCRAPVAGAGRQAATAPAQNQLSATYTLTQIGIRRGPASAPDAGVWTDLLAPADSEVGGLDDLLGDPELERQLQLRGAFPVGRRRGPRQQRSTRGGCSSTPIPRTPS